MGNFRLLAVAFLTTNFVFLPAIAANVDMEQMSRFPTSIDSEFISAPGGRGYFPDAVDPGFLQSPLNGQHFSSRQGRVLWIPLNPFASPKKIKAKFTQRVTPAPAPLTPFDQVILDNHNILRLIHGNVPPLRFNPDLKSLATSCANYHALARTNSVPDPARPNTYFCPYIATSNYPSASEALLIIDGLDDITPPTETARRWLWFYWGKVDATDWTNLIYTWNTQYPFQFIWRSTTDVGCALTNFTAIPIPPFTTQTFYMSCIYAPPGYSTNSAVIQANVVGPNV